MIRITGVSILKTRQEIDFGIPVTNRGHFSLPNKICEKTTTENQESLLC